MRIAVLIIALSLTIIVALQSCAVGFGGNLGGREEVSAAGGAGFLVALLFALGAAFAMGYPKVSMAVFAVAALIAFGFSGAFSDLKVWGIVALLLTGLSYMGSRELRRKLPVKAGPGQL
ncbi:hypothetical protein LGR54_01730 [Ancylobacter sp. Lp-2]|uniref:hypothetical protein n=1 Tax=Ancylobacter sp. Lp-2 TaxID=2881339 RepID=UPI001E5A03E4|nr:hypothetical protein [Ancylobacter sp. Lp-2]MCB4767312.1 hypothetical protein [Ancylobacter sp. Lp-2]